VSPLSHKPIRRKAVWLSGCKCEYGYSGLTFKPSKYPDWFIEFQTQVFTIAGVDHIGLNCCNVNYYPDGRHNLDWHSDDEWLFGDVSSDEVPILSLSIGASRTFLLQHTQSSILNSTELCNGDLLFMGGFMQYTHKHKIPADNSVCEPRINFTWRRIVNHSCG
jgi:alkylated DNA repair dioxygenase AlkB